MTSSYTGTLTAACSHEPIGETVRVNPLPGLAKFALHPHADEVKALSDQWMRQHASELGGLVADVGKYLSLRSCSWILYCYPKISPERMLAFWNFIQVAFILDNAVGAGNAEQRTRTGNLAGLAASWVRGQSAPDAPAGRLPMDSLPAITESIPVGFSARFREGIAIMLDGYMHLVASDSSRV